MTSRKLEIIAEPDKTTFSTRRVVDAPRELVFDMFTKAEHVRRWMGPRAFTMLACESDLRVGGQWRNLYRAPDGREFACGGEYREIVRPERVVRTFIFSPMPDKVAIETLTLEERDGKTTVIGVTEHKTVADRDGHLGSGMEPGLVEAYARLDELLVSLSSH